MVRKINAITRLVNILTFNINRLNCENSRSFLGTLQQTCSSKLGLRCPKKIPSSISPKTIIDASHSLIDIVCKLITVVGVFYLFFREGCDNPYSKRRFSLI